MQRATVKPTRPQHKPPSQRQTQIKTRHEKKVCSKTAKRDLTTTTTTLLPQKTRLENVQNDETQLLTRVNGSSPDELHLIDLETRLRDELNRERDPSDPVAFRVGSYARQHLSFSLHESLSENTKKRNNKNDNTTTTNANNNNNIHHHNNTSSSQSTKYGITPEEYLDEYFDHNPLHQIQPRGLLLSKGDIINRDISKLTPARRQQIQNLIQEEAESSLLRIQRLTQIHETIGNANPTPIASMNAPVGNYRTQSLQKLIASYHIAGLLPTLSNQNLLGSLSLDNLLDVLDNENQPLQSIDGVLQPVLTVAAKREYHRRQQEETIQDALETLKSIILTTFLDNGVFSIRNLTPEEQTFLQTYIKTNLHDIRGLDPNQPIPVGLEVLSTSESVNEGIGGNIKNLFKSMSSSSSYKAHINPFNTTTLPLSTLLQLNNNEEYQFDLTLPPWHMENGDKSVNFPVPSLLHPEAFVAQEIKNLYFPPQLPYYRHESFTTLDPVRNNTVLDQIGFIAAMSEEGKQSRKIIKFYEVELLKLLYSKNLIPINILRTQTLVIDKLTPFYEASISQFDANEEFKTTMVGLMELQHFLNLAKQARDKIKMKTTRAKGLEDNLITDQHNDHMATIAQCILHDIENADPKETPLNPKPNDSKTTITLYQKELFTKLQQLFNPRYPSLRTNPPNGGIDVQDNIEGYKNFGFSQLFVDNTRNNLLKHSQHSTPLSIHTDLHNLLINAMDETLLTDTPQQSQESKLDERIEVISTFLTLMGDELEQRIDEQVYVEVKKIQNVLSQLHIPHSSLPFTPTRYATRFSLKSHEEQLSALGDLDPEVYESKLKQMITDAKLHDSINGNNNNIEVDNDNTNDNNDDNDDMAKIKSQHFEMLKKVSEEDLEIFFQQKSSQMRQQDQEFSSMVTSSIGGLLNPLDNTDSILQIHNKSQRPNLRIFNNTMNYLYDQLHHIGNVYNKTIFGSIGHHSPTRTPISTLFSPYSESTIEYFDQSRVNDELMMIPEGIKPHYATITSGFDGGQNTNIGSNGPMMLIAPAEHVEQPIDQSIGLKEDEKLHHTLALSALPTTRFRPEEIKGASRYMVKKMLRDRVTHRYKISMENPETGQEEPGELSSSFSFPEKIMLTPSAGRNFLSGALYGIELLTDNDRMGEFKRLSELRQLTAHPTIFDSDIMENFARDFPEQFSLLIDPNNTDLSTKLDRDSNGKPQDLDKIARETLLLNHVVETMVHQSMLNKYFNQIPTWEPGIQSLYSEIRGPNGLLRLIDPLTGQIVNEKELNQALQKEIALREQGKITSQNIPMDCSNHYLDQKISIGKFVLQLSKQYITNEQKQRQQEHQNNQKSINLSTTLSGSLTPLSNRHWNNLDRHSSEFAMENGFLYQNPFIITHSLKDSSQFSLGLGRTVHQFENRDLKWKLFNTAQYYEIIQIKSGIISDVMNGYKDLIKYDDAMRDPSSPAQLQPPNLTSYSKACAAIGMSPHLFLDLRRSLLFNQQPSDFMIASQKYVEYENDIVEQLNQYGGEK